MNEERNLQGLVEQFGYHADELSAQRILLDRLPDTILNAVPLEGSRSIHDRYVDLLSRETKILCVISSAIEGGAAGTATEAEWAERVDSGMPSEPGAEPLATAELAQRMARLRSEGANMLANMSASVWKTPVSAVEEEVDLAAWIYRIVLEDADELKAIGEQFFEQQLTFAGNGS